MIIPPSTEKVPDSADIIIAIPQMREARSMLSAVLFSTPRQKEKKSPTTACIKPMMLANVPQRSSLHGPDLVGSFKNPLLSSKTIEFMYEVSNLATRMRMWALKAAVWPILIRAKRRLMPTGNTYRVKCRAKPGST